MTNSSWASTLTRASRILLIGVSQYSSLLFQPRTASPCCSRNGLAPLNDLNLIWKRRDHFRRVILDLPRLPKKITSCFISRVCLSGGFVAENSTRKSGDSPTWYFNSWNLFPLQ